MQRRVGRAMTTFCNSETGILVNCGCFNGTLDEFAVKVNETHGDNKHGKAYQLAVELAKLQMEESGGEPIVLETSQESPNESLEEL